MVSFGAKAHPANSNPMLSVELIFIVISPESFPERANANASATTTRDEPSRETPSAIVEEYQPTIDKCSMCKLPWGLGRTPRQIALGLRDKRPKISGSRSGP